MTEPDKKKYKYSLPTLDEQTQINNVEHLMNTNLLGLEVNEMVNEVSIKKKPSSLQKIDDFIDKLKTVISQNQYVGKPITEKWLLKRKHFNNSYLRAYTGSIATFQFQEIESIEVIGSYPIQSMTNPFLNIDLAMVMNRECFQERDILNYSYFDKRNLYVAVVYDDLLNNNDDELGQIQLRYFKGDSSKLFISLKPSIPGWTDLEIRLFPTVNHQIFKVIQLSSSKNNVRPKEWIEKLKQSSDTTNAHLDPSELKPTPHYNSAILEDFSIISHRKIIQSVHDLCLIIKDVLIIFKIWLTQRQYRFSLNSFDSHSAALLIAYLFQTKRITPVMTPIAGFQVILKFLSELSIPSALYFSSVDIQVNHGMDGVALYHPIGTKDKYIDYNAFWRINLSTWVQLQTDAKKSLDLIHSYQLKENVFSRLFLSKFSLIDHEDILFHIRIPRSVGFGFRIGTEDSSDIDETCWSHLSREVYYLLKKGLNNRITSLHVSISIGNSSPELSTQSPLLSYMKAHPMVESSDDFILTIGLSLAPEHAARKVDRGPSYEHTEELEKFREFWGTKCQLRRFQDGQILEAIVWEGRSWNTTTTKLSTDSTSQIILRGSFMVGEIIRYLLGKKYSHICGEDGMMIQSPSLSVEESLGSSFNSNSQTMNVQISSKNMIEALDSLRTILTSSIKGMPIMIESVQGLDSELRYTSTQSIIPHPLILIDSNNESESIKTIQGKKLSLLGSPIMILGTLETSGKWPNDTAAIQKLKIGIQLKLFELLKEQFQISSVIHESTMDIFYQGYIFRLVLLSDKEHHQTETSSSFPRHSIDRRDQSHLVFLSRHHQAIRSLVAAYPCYPDTVRCVNQWLHQNYLTGILSQEVVELITATIFLDPFPKAVAPSSPSIAFTNVLRCISQYDWKNNPLILNLDQSITTAEVNSIKQSFQSYRQQSFAHGVMKLPIYIVTSYNRVNQFQPIIWDYEVTSAELSLLVKNASESYTLMSKRLLLENETNADEELTINQLALVTSVLTTTRFNVILRFQKDVYSTEMTFNGFTPKYALFQSFKNTPMKHLSTHNLMVQWSSCRTFPIQEQIVSNIRKRFGKYALFFWNSMSGEDVGIVWKPAFFLVKKLSILECAYRQPELDGANHKGQASQESAITVPNCIELLSHIVSTCDGYIQSFDII